jgi:hypothetical protein
VTDPLLTRFTDFVTFMRRTVAGRLPVRHHLES